MLPVTLGNSHPNTTNPTMIFPFAKYNPRQLLYVGMMQNLFSIDGLKDAHLWLPILERPKLPF